MACPVCYSAADPLVRGSLNAGILVLLGVTTTLFAGVNADQCVLASLMDANFLGYDTIEECTTQAQFLLGHPQDALNIARAGNRAFSRMTPDIRADELFEWVFSGKLDSLYRVPGYTASVGNASPSLTDRVRVVP